MREDDLRRKLTMFIEGTRLEVFTEVVVASYLLDRVQVNPFKFEEDLYNSIARGAEIAVALQKIICNKYNLSYTPYKSIRVNLHDGNFTFAATTKNTNQSISYEVEQELTLDIYVHRLFELHWIYIISTIAGMILNEFLSTKKLGRVNQNLKSLFEIPPQFLGRTYPSDLNEVMLGLIVFSELVGQSDAEMFNALVSVLPYTTSSQIDFTFSTYEDKNNLLLKLLAKSLGTNLFQYELSNLKRKIEEAALKFVLNAHLNVFQKQMLRNLNVKVILDRGLVYTVQNIPIDVVYAKKIVILA